MSRRDEAGFTLIELLVVIMLLGVVGAVVTSGLVSAMQTTRSSQVRIEAMAELQRTAERVTRELRAACPVMRLDTEDHEAVTVAVVRGGTTTYHEFYLDVDDLRHEVRDDPLVDPVGGTILLQDLAEYDAGETLFTFLDEHGNPVSQPLDVRMVQMVLRRELPETDDEIEVTTTTSLRNGDVTCD